MLDYDQAIFRFKQNLGINKVGKLHHIKRWGDLYDANEQVDSIQGVDENTPCVITPDIDILHELPVAQRGRVNSANNIYKQKNEQDIVNLTLSTAVKYHPKEFHTDLAIFNRYI